MKPYGVKVIENPDVGDIRKMGAKSSTGHFPRRSGEYRGYCRNKAAKARREGRDACNEE